MHKIIIYADRKGNSPLLNYMDELEGIWNEDGTVRAGLNPAYRTSPFEVWTATGLAGKGWNWTLLPASAYAWDPTNAVIRIPDDTNRMRMLRSGHSLRAGIAATRILSTCGRKPGSGVWMGLMIFTKNWV